MATQARGFKETRAKLARARGKLDSGDIAYNAAKRWKGTFVDQAQARAPTPNTGTLNAGIGVEATGNRISVVSKAPYSSFLENGTRFIAPFYYMTGALLVTRALLVALVQEELRRALK